MTAKQPQAGEYWQKEDTRVFIVGTRKNGLTLGETECGTLIPFLPIHGWQHLSDCDSFEWQPKVWPKYYLPSSIATNAVFHRRDSEAKTVGVDQYGNEWNWQYDWDEQESARLVEITESEALARVKLVESPDDWVEITDPNHEPRDGVDWFNGGPSGQWIIHEPRHVRSTLKEYQQSWPMGRFRCRRRDLPPVESPKRVTVRLIGRRSGTVRWQELDESFDAHDIEIKHDGYKFYFEVQQ